MDKYYIRSRYHQVALELRLAVPRSDEWHRAAAELSRLEGLAMQIFGFAWADQLHASEFGE